MLSSCLDRGREANYQKERNGRSIALCCFWLHADVHAKLFCFCFYGCYIQLDNAAHFTMWYCIPLTGIVFLKFYIKLCCVTGAFTGFAYFYLTRPLQMCQQCCGCCFFCTVMHCTMTCLQDGKYLLNVFENMSNLFCTWVCCIKTAILCC